MEENIAYCRNEIPSEIYANVIYQTLRSVTAFIKVTGGPTKHLLYVLSESKQMLQQLSHKLKVTDTYFQLKKCLQIKYSL